MTFSVIDEVLTRQMAGHGRSPVAEHLDLRLVRFGRGVAVCEMPVRPEVCDGLGAVSSGVLAALGEGAMTAAATTTVRDPHTDSVGLVAREIRARFDRPVGVGDTEALRAEAVVMRADPESVRVEADVLCEGARVATFEATYLREGRSPTTPPREAAGDGASTGADGVIAGRAGIEVSR